MQNKNPPQITNHSKLNTEETYKTLTVFHQNVDRITNKIERLNHELSMSKPDITILTEHGLKKGELENVRLPGYSLVSSFSRANHQKGGVAIYKNDELGNNVVSLNIEEHSIELTCEISCISISLSKSKHIYILGIYRTSRCIDTTIDMLTEFLSDLLIQDNQILIMGDINIDSLKDNNDNLKFNELLATYNLHRLTLPATRITHNTSSSIDCICTNISQYEVDVEVVHTGLSDHTGQYCYIQIPTHTRETLTTSRRHLNIKNLGNLKLLLSAQNWENVTSATSVNETYNNFSNIIASSLNSACPYKKSRNRQRTQRGVVNDAEALILKRDFISSWEKYNRTGREEDKREALEKKKNYDLKLRALRQLASEAHIQQASNKSKALWEVINGERTPKFKQVSNMELRIKGSLTTDPKIIADHMNTYFVNIANETLKQNGSPGQLSSHTNDIPSLQTMALQPTTLKEVQMIIDSLKPKTSAGNDEVSAKVLKHCRDELCPILVHLINKSFSQGIFPSGLKTAKVYAKHKLGDKTEPSNYRPISLLPTFSKVIEKVALTRLLEHLKWNGLLTERQHGFIRGRSTATALIDLIEHIIDCLEAGDTVMGLFIDYSKAFDCLNHDLIIRKLNGLGIHGVEASWFRDYLDGRSQVVEIEYTAMKTTTTVKSEPLPIQRGVPQGSVLGPVLFILVINDLPQHLHDYAYSIMYADDTVLVTGKKNTEDLEVASYIALNVAAEYSFKNDLALNKSKTKQIVLGKNRENVSELPNIMITDKLKHLGVIIDDKLSWEEHTNTLCQKLSSAIFAIRRIKTVSTQAASITAYYALFESHLRYGIVVWGGSTARTLQRVLILQKKAVRTILGLGARDSCRQAFKDLKILTAPSLYILETVLHARTQDLPRHQDRHSYQTRSASNYALPQHRTTLYEKKPTYTGAYILNILPETIKNESRNSLKKKLTTWLLQHSFYSLDELFNFRANEH